ncbi:MAG: DNA alkylation repair protein, partial [Clostridia bacterium]|nr:DNA alkylation repair protein [Clostridia bacterium]
QNWVNSEKTYTVRYGIGTLLSYYLTDQFTSDHLKLVSEIKSDEYYVNMMIAWYFATALALQQEQTLPYLTEYRLSDWIHNKTIQKAVESYRISTEIKNKLKKLKIK